MFLRTERLFLPKTIVVQRPEVVKGLGLFIRHMSMFSVPSGVGYFGRESKSTLEPSQLILTKFIADDLHQLGLRRRVNDQIYVPGSVPDVF